MISESSDWSVNHVNVVLISRKFKMKPFKIAIIIWFTGISKISYILPKMQEMPFQRPQISKNFRGTCPLTPLELCCHYGGLPLTKILATLLALMTVYECQLFTWPYIIKNNADWIALAKNVQGIIEKIPPSARLSWHPAWLHPLFLLRMLFIFFLNSLVILKNFVCIFTASNKVFVQSFK